MNKQRKPPHVVIIMADQLRYDLLGQHTPRINELFDESCVYPNTYCASPLCVPARGAFFTGLYPNQNGCFINPWEPSEREYGHVNSGIENLYAAMENHWDCWHAGKQHLLTENRFDQSSESNIHWLTLANGYELHLKKHGKRKPGGPAFRALCPEMVNGRITRPHFYSIPTTGCYEEGLEFFFDGFIRDSSLQAIEERNREQPMFLSAMFLAPHPPLEIPEPFFSEVKTIEMPENVGQWYTGQSPLQMYNLTGFFGSRYTRDMWQEPWRVYAGLVKLLDKCVGDIIDKLKAENMYDDSLILFTSDHGEMLGSHGLWQKMCMYQESVKTPLAIKMPKSESGLPGPTGLRSDLVSHIDVLPTLRDILDLPGFDTLPGHSLKESIESGAPVGRESLFIQFDGNGARGNFSRCIIEGNEKLIVDLFKDEIFFELYDIDGDPQETKNLAFEQPLRAQTLLDKLSAIMTETQDPLSIPEDALTRFLQDYQPWCAPST